MLKQKTTSKELFSKGLTDAPWKKSKKEKIEITPEIKEGYYRISDGTYDLLDKLKDTKSQNILKQIENLQTELYNHLGGL